MVGTVRYGTGRIIFSKKDLKKKKEKKRKKEKKVQQIKNTGNNVRY